MWENTDEIFNWVLRGSLYSAVVAFIIVLAQKLTRRALSAQWLYALWLILLVRLVLPAGTGPETNWSLWNLTTLESLSRLSAADSGRIHAVNTAIMPPAAGDAAGYRGKSTREQPGADRLSQNIGGFSPGGIMQALPVIWLAGALVMVAAAALVNLRLWNSVRGLSPATDSRLLELFEDCKRWMGVKTIVGLVVTDRVENPFLFGFIRPRVLLPADFARHASSDQLRCVLLHEIAHLKRGDIMIGWLLAILQSLHWFNPVIWWAFYRMRFDRETACDALVLSRMPDGTRRHYGDALIGMMEHFKRPRHLSAIVAGIIENKKQLKRRLVMIRKFRCPARCEIIAFVALLAVLSIGLLTEPRLLQSSQLAENQYKDFTVFIPGDLKKQADEPDTSDTPDTPDTPIPYKPMNEQMRMAFDNSQARNNLEIGDFYRERGNLIGAIQRYHHIVENYENFEDMDAVIQRIAELYYDKAHGPDPDIAARASVAAAFWYSRIAEDYPFSRYHEEAERRLAALNGETADASSRSEAPSETGSFQFPEILDNPKPIYTKEAHEARVEGIVVLKGIIRKDGTFDDVEVAHSLGYGLDESAIRAVADWRFRPAMRDGVPVDYPAFMETSFSLFRENRPPGE